MGKAFETGLKAALYAAVGLAISTFIGLEAGVTFASQFFTRAVLGQIVSVGVLTMIGVSLSKKQDNPLADNFGSKLSKISGIAPRQIVYGETRVGGTIIYAKASGIDNSNLNIIVAVAGHEIQSIEKIFINKEEVTASTSTIDGATVSTVTNVKFTNTDNPNALDVNGRLIQFISGLGADNQEMNPYTIAQTDFTDQHDLKGIAYVHFKMVFDQQKLTSLPEISFQVKGKKVFDPRNSQTAWTNNPALIVRDFLTDTRYGLKAISSNDSLNEINDNTSSAGNFVSAANACEVQVADSSGTNQNKYTANGFLNASTAGSEALNGILSSCAGKVTYVNGQFNIFVGVAQTASLTITDDDLVAEIQMTNSTSLGKLQNTVKPIFVDADNKFTTTDSAVRNTGKDSSGNAVNYLNIDTPTGETSSNYKKEMEVKMPFVTNESQAERLGQLNLNYQRRTKLLEVSTTLKFLELVPGNYVNVTNERLGFSAKTFEVLSVNTETSSGDNPVVFCQLALKEIDNNVFAFDTANDYIGTTENSQSDDGLIVISPPTLASDGLSQGNTNDNGTIKSHVDVTWTNASSSSIFQTEIQWRVGGTFGTPTSSALVEPDQTTFRIENAVRGAQYYVRVRHKSASTVSSAFSTVRNITIAGDTTAPSVPTNLSASTGLPSTIKVTWTNPSDTDLRAVKVYRKTVDSNPTDDSTVIATISGEPSKASTIFTGVEDGLVYGTNYFFWVRAVDYSGNESALSSSVSGNFVRIRDDDFQGVGGGIFFFNQAGNNNAPDDSAFNTQEGRKPRNEDIVISRNTTNNESVSYKYTGQTANSEGGGGSFSSTGILLTGDLIGLKGEGVQDILSNTTTGNQGSITFNKHTTKLQTFNQYVATSDNLPQLVIFNQRKQGQTNDSGLNAGSIKFSTNLRDSGTGANLATEQDIAGMFIDMTSRTAGFGLGSANPSAKIKFKVVQAPTTSGGSYNLVDLLTLDRHNGSQLDSSLNIDDADSNGYLHVGDTTVIDASKAFKNVLIADHTPSSTTNRLYQNSGTLFWNGNQVGVGAINSVTNMSDNRVITASGSNSLNGEANLTFDGTTLALTGNQTISGNLTVSGTTTTIDTTNLDVKDKNITLNFGSGDTSSNANGAGITIQDAVDASTDATILWNATADRFDFSHGLRINADAQSFTLGASGDFSVSHNGTNTFMANNTGIFYITQNTDDANFLLRADDGSGGVANYIILKGSTGEVILGHYGNAKLKTTSTGIDVTGVAVVDGLTSSAAITSTSNSNSLGGTTFTSAVSGTSLSLSASITASGNSNTFGNSSFGTISSGDITITDTSPKLRLTDSDTGADSDISGSSSNGSLFLSADTNNEVANTVLGFQVDGSTKFYVGTDGFYAISTKIIDASTRNLLNIGSISSGAITATGAGLAPQLQIVDSDNTTGRLQVSHNSSTSSITSVGTSGFGTVQIGGSSSGTGSTYATFNSTGIDVTGTTVTDGITSDGSIVVSGDDRNINFDSSTKIIGDHSVDGLQIRTQNTDPIVFKTNGNNIRYKIDGSGNFKVIDTTIIDQSRNLTNIGTISSGTITSSGNIDVNSDSGQLQFGADNDMQIFHNGANGEINNATGNFTIDSAGDISLDADGGDVRFVDDGTIYGNLANESGNFAIKAVGQDTDIRFKGNDGGSVFTALSLDMSASGAATFNDKVTIGGNLIHAGNLTIDAGGDITLDADGQDILFKDAGTQFGSIRKNGNNLQLMASIQDGDITFHGDDGGSAITALTLDMSAGGNATFAGDITSSGKVKGSNMEILGASGSSGFLYIFDSDNGTSNTDGFLLQKSGNNAFVYNRESSGSLSLGAGNTSNYLVIDSSGNIDLGSTQILDQSRNLTNIGSYAGSGSVLVGNTSANFSELTAVGSLELCRTDANGFIDFRSALSEDFDCRIQQSSNGLAFSTGGNGSTATALTLDSSRNATFAGSVTATSLSVSSAFSTTANINISGTSGKYQINSLDVIEYSGGFRVGSVSDDDESLTLVGFGGQPNIVLDDSVIQFKFSTSEKMRLDSSGRLGIGTSSPTQELHIQTTNSQVEIVLGSSSQTSSIFNNANAAFGILDGSSERLRVDSSGRLGIGTTAPTSRLTVKSSSTSSQDSAITVQGNANTNAIFKVGEKSADGGRLHMFDGGVEKIAFYTDGTANHISAGFLGLGTSSPDHKLHVDGNIKLTGSLISDNTTIIDSSRNLTSIGTITSTGRHFIQSGNLQMNNGNNSHRYYYVSTGSGGGDFLLGQIEFNDGVDGAIEGTVCFAYDYGTTSESPKIHFSFAQRNGTARGKWWYEHDDDAAGSNNVKVVLIDDGSGGMFVWLRVSDFAKLSLNVITRQGDNWTNSGQLSSGTITTGTTLFDTSNDPTSEHHIGKLFAHGDSTVVGNFNTSGGITVGDSSADALRFVGILKQGLGSGTTVMDSSRNLTNIGTISSGAITSSGNISTGSSSTLTAHTINFTGELNFTNNGNKIIDVFTKANGNNLKIRHHDPSDNSFETAAQFTAGGGAVFLHAGNTKLQTTSTGIDVTGVAVVDGLTSSAIATVSELEVDNDSTFNGGLDINGNATFGDNNKAIFGAGSDLQIYHDGNHSYIQDSGTGRLRFQASTQIDFLNGAGTETLANFIENDAIKLYFNNALKLATTSTGIDVTGLVKVTDQFQSISGSRTLVMNANFSGLGAIGMSSNDHLTFVTNNTERMRLDNAGSLAVGNTSPSSFWGQANKLVLDASGNTGMTIKSTSSGNGRIVFTDQSSSNPGLSDGGQIHYVHSADDMRFRTAGADRVTINATGVGITVTSPTSKLNINTESDQGIAIFRTGTNANFDAIQFRKSNNSDLNSRIGFNENQLRLDGTNDILFGTGGSYTERMRINASGRVGIGTDSPSLALEVNDTSNVDGEQISIKGHANYGGTVVFRRGDSFNWRVGVGGGSSTNSTIPSSFFGFEQGNTLNLVIAHTTGNVGIADATPLTKLEVAGSIKATNRDTGHTGEAGVTLSYNTSSQIALLETWQSKPLVIDTFNYQQFNIGNTLAMFIDGTNRNVGINTNTPAVKLDVSGDARIKASSDSATNLTLKRNSSSGRSQFALTDESDNQLWRVGLTGAGGEDFVFYDGGANVLILDRSSNASNFGGNIQMGGTTVIDSSRNLTNIGTIATTDFTTATTAVTVQNKNLTVLNQPLNISSVNNGRLKFFQTTSGASVTKGSIQWFSSGGFASASIRVVGDGADDNSGKMEFYVTANSDEVSDPFDIAKPLILTDDTIQVNQASLLVGKTAQNSAATGVEARSGGLFIATRASAVVGIFNRTTSDGVAVQFRKNNTVVGQINVTSSATSYNTTSDARLKDVTGYARGLKVINKLNPVAFNWKADGKADEGLIAQEVEKIVPNAVTKEDDLYQMDYSKLVVHLIKAVQEQQEEIEKLKEEVKLYKRN